MRRNLAVTGSSRWAKPLRGLGASGSIVLLGFTISMPPGEPIPFEESVRRIKFRQTPDTVPLTTCSRIRLPASMPQNSKLEANNETIPKRSLSTLRVGAWHRERLRSQSFRYSWLSNDIQSLVPDPAQSAWRLARGCRWEKGLPAQYRPCSDAFQKTFGSCGTSRRDPRMTQGTPH